ncbi:hypothetical protein B0H14DRAFT_2612062 [Mycena olivaceomarginata]|nr:hypothetical protein B0H14DRAFT_2612062 [Mycena olivaceomarginata]
MSNNIVPLIYRSVIDEVIAAVKPDFEEAGLAQNILTELQYRWEDKVIASRVADFEPSPLNATRMMPEFSPLLWAPGPPVFYPRFAPVNENNPNEHPEKVNSAIIPLPTVSPSHIPQIDGSAEHSQEHPGTSPSEAISNPCECVVPAGSAEATTVGPLCGLVATFLALVPDSADDLAVADGDEVVVARGAPDRDFTRHKLSSAADFIIFRAAIAHRPGQLTRGPTFKPTSTRIYVFSFFEENLWTPQVPTRGRARAHAVVLLDLVVSAFPHLKDGVVHTAQMIKRTCKAGTTIYVPLDEDTIPIAIVVPKHAVPHTHPPPPPTKVPTDVRTLYEEAVRAVGVSIATVNKVERGAVSRRVEYSRSLEKTFVRPL